MPSKKATILWKKNNPKQVRKLHKKYNLNLNHKYSALKAKAKYYELKMTITKEQFFNLMKNYCFYCKNNLPLTGYGLDRLDNTKGYIINNVVSCCKICNRKKGNIEAAGFKYPRSKELLQELLILEHGKF